MTPLRATTTKWSSTCTVEAVLEYSAVAGSGLFGTDIDNIKFIFPSSTITGGVWYETYKEGSISDCDFGMFSECSYNLNDMKKSGK